MALYICHQCASTRALRRSILRVTPVKASESLSLPGFLPAPRFLTSIRSRPDQASKASSRTKGSSSTTAVSANAPIRSNPGIKSPAVLPATAPATSSAAATLDPARMEHIEAIKRRIDQLAHRLEVDALYLEFWKICCTETIEDQRLIWHNENVFPHDVRQECFYRAFNSSANPWHTAYPSDHPLVHGKRIPPSMFTVRGDRTVPSSRQRELISPKADPLFKYHTIHFTSGSHVKRLLQVHHYFEQVLELTVGYYSKIALVVALSSKGDMITVRKLFAKWQGRQHKDKRAHGDGSNQGTSEAGGKEIYSAVIRGLVGRNFRDSEIRPYYVATDASSGTRNNSITQMHAALELFYDLLRKGGTPSFETYHSLVVGLAVFKNDMEAAELLLDHMIIKKKKPYVQVLHVMCREYVRRNDYPKAERIFGMLQEYGIRPRALTCNIMLRAVFRMSDVDALQHLGHRAPDAPRGSEEPEAMARQLKRQKIRRVLEYMRENETVPDQETFSTLIYGYGHMEDGYPDLKEAMVEMSREQSQIEPNLIILNSLLFAHLNHGKIKIAESILDQMLSTPHPAADQAEFGNKRPQQQVLSPFRRRRQEQMEDEVNEVDDKRDVRQSHKRAVYDKTMMMVPGKGTFHALMLAHVERGDIVGMERVLDKMIQTQRQQQEQRVKLQSMYRPRWRPMPPLVDLEGDEYTANIMLLGYLSQRDFAKVDILQKQIQSRPDWKSNFMFQDREVNMEQMIEFVKQQSSRTIVERSLQQPGRHRDPSTSWTTSNSPDSTASSRMTTAFDPLNGNGEGVLDDDIEIDVTTLSAKLRGLMKSSGTTSSTSPTSTTASTSSSSSASASPSSSSPSSSSPPFSSSQD